MWNEAWAMIRAQSTRDGHAASLVQLALGAGTFGLWDRAEIAAAEALVIARERKEGEAIITAEGILNTLQGGVIAEYAMNSIFKDRIHAGKRDDSCAADMVADFATAMRARQDDAPESPTRALVHPAG
jgi:hypothetical protein